MSAQFKAQFSLEAMKAIADREGLSPQANVIQIQNNNTAQSNAAIVPIFAEQSADFKALLGGE